MTDTGTPGWRPGPGWLFCPADRPERYAKALAGSDQVVLDLEDAVSPDRKIAARAAVRELAAVGLLDRSRTVIRVNAAGTADHGCDVELVSDLGMKRVMLSKSESPDQIANLPCEVVLLCESPLGVERAGELATVHTVVAVMWGGEDLIAGLGGSGSRGAQGRYRDVVRWARSRCLVAAKAHQRLALDAVYLNIPDVPGLAAEAEEAAAVGFDAKVAIHPSQVPVIQAAFMPSLEEIDWARRLLGAASHADGVFTVEGRMVDGPIFLQAKRTLARARVDETSS